MSERTTPIPFTRAEMVTAMFALRRYSEWLEGTLANPGRKKRDRERLREMIDRANDLAERMDYAYTNAPAPPAG